MDQSKRIDKILEAVEARIQEEVGSLLGGAPFLLQDGNRLLVDKSDAFGRLTGKQICAHIDILGDTSGRGCLLIGIKDAIRLAGTLIMLPGSELEEVIGREDYSEEIEDSYGEIANIIAGAYGSDFEQMYSDSCRFMRKTQEILVPAKVDIESDDPVENQKYYQVSCTMTLGDRQMGELIMLIPASTFGIGPQGVDEDTSIAPHTPNGDASQEDFSEGSISAGERENVASAISVTDQKPQNGNTPSFDIEKQKSKVDLLLAECQKKMGSEISALLGVEVVLTDLNNRFMSKEEFFFEQVSGRQVLTEMEVTGANQNTSYLSISVKDAIHLGGILIMLPPAELDNVISEEDFGEDASDAYGEVANIISGVYTANFEEHYIEKLRFIKKEFNVVEPLQVTSSSQEPMPDESYYCSSMSLQVESKQLGKIHMLFPVDVLKLDNLQQVEDHAGPVHEKSQEEDGAREKDGVVSSLQHPAGDSESRKSPGPGGGKILAEQIGTGANGVALASNGRLDSNQSYSVDILLVEDDDAEASKIADVLKAMGYSVKVVTFKDNVHNYISRDLKAVYLVMNEINEQTFGMAIKVSAACSMPLIAAGSRWTKTKVIKAVKYGVRDILLTPASKQDIQENVASNLPKLAA